MDASLDAAAEFVEGEGPGDAAVEAVGVTSFGTAFHLFGGDHGAGGIGHDAGGGRALGHQAGRTQCDRTGAGNAGGGGTHQGRHRPLDAVAGAGAHQGTAIAAAQIRGAAGEGAADGIGADGGAIKGVDRQVGRLQVAGAIDLGGDGPLEAVVGGGGPHRKAAGGAVSTTPIPQGAGQGDVQAAGDRQDLLITPGGEGYVSGRLSVAGLDGGGADRGADRIGVVVFGAGAGTADGVGRQGPRRGGRR